MKECKGPQTIKVPFPLPRSNVARSPWGKVEPNRTNMSSRRYSSRPSWGGAPAIAISRLYKPDSFGAIGKTKCCRQLANSSRFSWPSQWPLCGSCDKHCKDGRLSLPGAIAVSRSATSSGSYVPTAVIGRDLPRIALIIESGHSRHVKIRPNLRSWLQDGLPNPSRSVSRLRCGPRLRSIRAGSRLSGCRQS
jgi:hypothetical protein